MFRYTKNKRCNLLNGYEAEISAVPAAICFDGLESVTQVFSASITADVLDLPIL
ncbi:MAG: hypothetical protein CM15mP107_3500 [Bacteroidota bacterium]|nr:MAG: hypothetical protein CM15mP107_3500 [Bacteroidota bacterium]